MDIDSQSTTQPISDDQELAKVLAGVNQEVENSMALNDDTTTPTTALAVEEDNELPAPTEFKEEVNNNMDNTDQTDNLDDIKKDALFNLRPLVEKLELVPDEKFDIYLLLLRSSDDKSLIAPAYNAAKNIQDETRRAQALLDIIKEIDFLTNQTA